MNATHLTPRRPRAGGDPDAQATYGLAFLGSRLRGNDEVGVVAPASAWRSAFTASHKDASMNATHLNPRRPREGGDPNALTAYVLAFLDYSPSGQRKRCSAMGPLSRLRGNDGVGVVAPASAWRSAFTASHKDASMNTTHLNPRRPRAGGDPNALTAYVLAFLDYSSSGQRKRCSAMEPLSRLRGNDEVGVVAPASAWCSAFAASHKDASMNATHLPPRRPREGGDPNALTAYVLAFLDYSPSGQRKRCSAMGPLSRLRGNDGVVVVAPAPLCSRHSASSTRTLPCHLS